MNTIKIQLGFSVFEGLMFGAERFQESGNDCFKSDRSVDLIRSHMRIFTGT